MKVTHETNIDANQVRNLMAFPRIKEFLNLLYERIDMQVENILDLKFTIFINLLPRDHQEGELIQIPRFGHNQLIYGGIETQKELLGIPINPHPHLEEAWAKLPVSSSADNLLSTNTDKIGSHIFLKFKLGNFNLSDFRHNKLSSYFERQLTGQSEDEDGPYQWEEFVILSSYFEDLNKYSYISLPLIQFAEFDGVVHIIYHQDENHYFFDERNQPKLKTIGQLIKLFSREYEGIIFDWDVVGLNAYRTSVIKSLVDPVMDPLFYDNMSKNPILKELKYREHYAKHIDYAERRINLSDEVPQTINTQGQIIQNQDVTIQKQSERIEQLLRHNAVMAIMLDSYTHNISAHSLVALERWFKQRSIKHGNYPKSIREELNAYIEKVPLILDPRQFNEEIQQLLRFLLEKGAFWTGLSKEKTFGGTVHSFYKVFWHDFFLNTLYLGTIANTEDILKLKVNLLFVEPDFNNSGKLLKRKKIRQKGHFLTIDMARFNTSDADKSALKGDYISGFIKTESQFDDLKKELEKIQVFFPGGIVGEHALFTIIENEIRNVKHYPKEDLEQMVLNGLNLNISFEAGQFNLSKSKRTKETQPIPHYYKIGVWLDHPVDLSLEKIEDRLTRLGQDIITEESKLPRLGGSYQDKVCAGMLFNDSFHEVEKKTGSERHEAFYPWVKTGYGPVMEDTKGTIFEELEISHRRFFNPDSQQTVRQEIKAYLEKHKRGTYKKFFHIWRGADIHTLKHLSQLSNSWENLARFRFIHLPAEIPFEAGFDALREKGIVRIIRQETDTIEQAYAIWLREWLTMEMRQPTLTYFGTGDETNFEIRNALFWDGVNAVWGDRDHSATPHLIKKIVLIHQNDEVRPNPTAIKYRNNGVLIQHYLQNQSVKDLQKYNMPAHLALELLETLYTQVCIWDNRIHKFFTNISAEKMEKLGCYAFTEDKPQWEKINQADPVGFFRYNFLVIHLSFIEKFIGTNGRKYSEETIDEFIDQEILMGRPRPHNFLIVITSGRGRNQWNETLNKMHKSIGQYTSFVTFRPVEALLEAAEKSLIKMDDFELKYSLLKILFGS